MIEHSFIFINFNIFKWLEQNDGVDYGTRNSTEQNDIVIMWYKVSVLNR